MRRALSGLAKQCLEILAFGPRAVRRRLAFALDAVCCILSVFLALALRIGEWPRLSVGIIAFSVTSFAAWVVVSQVGGVYRNLIRYSGAKAIIGVCCACGWLVLVLGLAFSLRSVDGVPRTMSVLQPLVFFLLLALSRLLIRVCLNNLPSLLRLERRQRRKVAIYGAGRAGRQLAASLLDDSHIAIVGFLDDDNRLDGQIINGVPVWHAGRLQELVGNPGLTEVLLALPSVSRSRRCEIVAELQKYELEVKTLPGIGQLVNQEVTVNDLREVQVDDLLGRDPVTPNAILMGRTVVGMTVMVSGAGGSIGAELCRQILAVKPKRLILAEQSEYALYAIDSELRGRLGDRADEIEIVAELVDVAQAGSVNRLFQRWKPDTVYHAAAYKHVPLVEANPVRGLYNNIFGTLHSVLAAEDAGVRRFVLISTDKAVRPTNIMGASKRICELILQARAQQQEGTVFTMVRFGNVLGSSGSVVPRFREQIRAGGPVTITHNDITRYFMTIPEAAQLVIQASGMARGGDVFVLDMGQPVRIRDLAETMVRLSGRSVRDGACPDGDIEIVQIGLRPGEKLYEELLIGDNPTPTKHPRIMRAQENMIPWAHLRPELELMEHHLRDGGASRAITAMCRLVPEYRTREIQEAIVS
jgi:FlaA1/EpsC-like NDP-sugar epimerase